MDRKLATIFASDVVGFSTMMGKDEVNTLNILKERRIAIDAIIDELKKLRAEFGAHRDQVLPNLDDLNTTMPTKADKSDLEDLENRLMEQMRDAIA